MIVYQYTFINYRSMLWLFSAFTYVYNQLDLFFSVTHPGSAEWFTLSLVPTVSAQQANGATN
jgi:hypothetical protein